MIVFPLRRAPASPYGAPPARGRPAPACLATLLKRSESIIRHKSKQEKDAYRQAIADPR